MESRMRERRTAAEGIAYLSERRNSHRRRGLKRWSLVFGAVVLASLAGMIAAVVHKAAVNRSLANPVVQAMDPEPRCQNCGNIAKRIAERPLVSKGSNKPYAIVATYRCSCGAEFTRAEQAPEEPRSP